MLYPAPPSDFEGHADIAATRISRGEIAGNAQHNLQRRIEELTTSSCETAILSDEDYFFQDCTDFLPLFDTVETTIIVYLRNPFAFEQSAAAYEALCFTHFSESPVGLSPLGPKDCQQEALARTHYSFSILLDNWIYKLPRSWFLFKNFDHLTRNNTFLEDFMTTVGIQDTRRYPRVLSNASLKPDYAFFLGHTNAIPLSQPDRILVLQELKELSRQDRSAPRYRLFDDDYLFSISADKIARIYELGDITCDPDFFSRGYAEFVHRPYVPYRQLPAEIQHRIFLNLSLPAQQAIQRACPRAMTAPTDSALLPDMPETWDMVQAISRWHNALRLSTQQESSLRPNVP